MKKLTLLLVTLLFAGVQMLQAQRTITGTVISADDNRSIPGVTVQVKGTGNGTTTNINGQYTLSVPSDATTLVFTFMGMETQEVEIGGRITIDIVMSSGATTLDEFVVTAYGVARRSTFTGSAAVVGSEQLAGRSVTNVANALAGNVAGVQMTSGSGQPGEAGDIRIRGIGSINASNSPLIILDGAPITESALAGLNFDDIASFTVLKDASSAALYGSRAANGVILITTKTGRHDRSGFDVQFTTGFVSRGLKEYEMLGPEQSYEMFWLGRRNQLLGTATPPAGTANLAAMGITASNDFMRDFINYNITNVPDNMIVLPNGQFNPNATINPYVASDLNWFDPITRLGNRSTLNVSTSMANDKSDMRASLSYLTEEGYIVNSAFNRLSARININHRVNKWIKTGLNVSAMTSTQEIVNAESSSSSVNIFASPRTMGRIFPVHAHDLSRPWGESTFIRDKEGNKFFDYGNGSLTGNGSIGPNGPEDGRGIVRRSQTNRSAIAELLLDQRQSTRNELGGRTYVEFSFLEDFKFTVNMAHDRRFFNTDNMYNPWVGDNVGGRVSKTRSLRTTTTINQLLNWNKQIGKHNLDALVGHESYALTYGETYISKSGVILPNNPELSNYITVSSASGYEDNYRLESYLSRFTYSWDDKYFASASWRTDGSSKFSPQNRWGQFWSIGGGWRLDKENFIKNLGFLPYLKLRSAYGQVGNDAGISNYAWRALYSTGGNYNNAEEAGMRRTSLNGENVVWESSDNFDIAVEFGTKWGIRGQIEFFHRQSTNLLFEVPIPLSFGLPDATELQNIGTMFNRGWEFELAYDLRTKSGFTWTPSLVLTTFVNRITKLPEGQKEIISGNMQLKEGHGIYDFYLREFRGVDPRDGRILYTWNSGQSAGENRIIDGDTLTLNQSAAKYSYVGKSAIPDLIGGLTNTFSWKGFDLSILTTFQLGGYVVDNIYQLLMSTGSSVGAFHPDILKSWKEPGQITNIPRNDRELAVNLANEAISSRSLTSASFFQLRSINFGYNLPKDFVSRMGLSKARTFFVAENVFVATARQGMNPAQRFSGSVSSSDGYIPSRFFMFGVNVHF